MRVPNSATPIGKLMTYLSSREVAIAQSGSVRLLSGKADIRTVEGVRELCESVLMGCDGSWVSQRASAGSI
jgi:hypothetical protein